MYHFCRFFLPILRGGFWVFGERSVYYMGFVLVQRNFSFINICQIFFYNKTQKFKFKILSCFIKIPRKKYFCHMESFFLDIFFYYNQGTMVPFIFFSKLIILTKFKNTSLIFCQCKTGVLVIRKSGGRVLVVQKAFFCCIFINLNLVL